MTIMRRLGRYTAAADGQHPGGELDIEDAHLGQLAQRRPLSIAVSTSGRDWASGSTRYGSAVRIAEGK